MKLSQLLLILLILPLTMLAQDEVEKYTIDSVVVRGNQFADSKALVVIAGLKEGSTIVVPEDLQAAIKNLWDLKLFSDIRILQKNKVGDRISLELQVLEKPKLSRYELNGVKGTTKENLEEKVDRHLSRGGIVTEVAKARAVASIKQYYEDKGYYDASVDVKESLDTVARNATVVVFDVARNDRVKIGSIDFVGNEEVPDKKLKKKFKNTKSKKRFLASSKLINSDYEEDKAALVNYYGELGYRDAQILRDSVWRNEDGELMIAIHIEEGKQYFFRKITWKGNTLYSNEQLSNVLDINKGDIYNRDLLETRLTFSLEGNDVSALYQDNGYLFFSAEPAEVAVVGDSIDVEVRIYEGPQATVDRVVIRGNDRTHEHVIRRELFTRPGKKFSRSDIIRSQRKIIGLGYFDQESLGINTPVNPQRGTVDIEYDVTERSSDQLELSAGYQPSNQFTRGGLIGTFGLQFNNFSLRNILNTEAWHPLPIGDGQKLSVRLQSNGRAFRSLNFSFTEPWLGGTKPNSLTIAAYNTKQSLFTDLSRNLSITQFTLGLGKRLNWPDENFVLNNSLNYRIININNFGQIFQADDGTQINNGSYNTVFLNTTLARNTVYDPLFPKEGSLFQLSLELTPPFSALNDDKSYSNDDLQEKYKWIEYHKWNFKAEWYRQVFGKFVLRSAFKMGYVGTFSDRYGVSPFERIQFGAEPLQNQNTIVGLDPITLRGYEISDFPEVTNSFDKPRGAALYDKFTLELRYPLSLNPSSTIYALTFVEAGNAWNRIQDFDPFDVRRSVGAGLRVFLPMFGLLGFDYSIGFDKPAVIQAGGNLGDYGKFTILLGFEPE